MAIQRRKPAFEPLPPVRNQRRALSHVGGPVSYTGSAELRPVLETALRVSPDEDETRNHVHGFHSYPGRLHPATARTLVSLLSVPGDRILDPFCGSGTVLVEARALGRPVVGADVNPLGVRLARLKLIPGTAEDRASWLKSAEEIAAFAEERRVERAPPSYRYPAVDRELFEIHVLLELDSLRMGIKQLQDVKARRALLFVLSSLLTKVSRRHGDSSVKASERRLPSGRTIKLFVARAKELVKRLQEYAALIPSTRREALVNIDDARRLESVESRSIDLVITSPPYPGVYDYHDHHAARLRWLGLDQQGFKEAEIGSRRQLNNVAAERAVQQWEKDLAQTLGALKRVLRPGKRACFVVGDAAVSGLAIRGDETLKRLAEKSGFEVLGIASQTRPEFHAKSSRAFAGRPRREHLVVIQAPGSAKATAQDKPAPRRQTPKTETPARGKALPQREIPRQRDTPRQQETPAQQETEFRGRSIKVAISESPRRRRVLEATEERPRRRRD